MRHIEERSQNPEVRSRPPHPALSPEYGGEGSKASLGRIVNLEKMYCLSGRFGMLLGGSASI